MKIPNIDKAMPAKGDGEEAKFLFKLASETPEEETQMMQEQKLLEYFLSTREPSWKQ